LCSFFKSILKNNFKIIIDKPHHIRWIFYFYTMDITQYLDSTYLKTPLQAGLSTEDNLKIVEGFIAEAIEERFKLIMIRPDMVSLAKKMITAAQSKVLIGTVIGFPEGTATLEEKLAEANQAILDGADDLDFVCNYQKFINGEIQTVKHEILLATKLGLDHHKTVKWIIEVAALTNQQIIQLSALIKNVVIANFKEDYYQNVFVKSSTGFYKTEDGKPNGATVQAIVMMLENCSPLPVKAAGGVRTHEEALEMISLGVKRIGTSAAKAIAHGQISDTTY
jgi:deoxyribose-phosphate aldolase